MAALTELFQAFANEELERAGAREYDGTRNVITPNALRTALAAGGKGAFQMGAFMSCPKIPMVSIPCHISVACQLP